MGSSAWALSGPPDVPQGLICLNHLRPRWRPALRLGHPACHKGWSCRPWWPKAQRYSKPRPQYGAGFGRHGKRRQDQVGIDANRAGPCNRHKGANDDDGAKEFMMRVQEQRKEKTKNQRQLQKRGTSMIGATARAESRKPCAAATMIPE